MWSVQCLVVRVRAHLIVLYVRVRGRASNNSIPVSANGFDGSMAAKPAIATRTSYLHAGTSAASLQEACRCLHVCRLQNQ